MLNVFKKQLSVGKYALGNGEKFSVMSMTGKVETRY